MDYYKLKACGRCGGDLARDDGDWICMQCGAYSYVGLYRQQDSSLNLLAGLPTDLDAGAGTTGPAAPLLPADPSEFCDFSDFSRAMFSTGTLATGARAGGAFFRGLNSAPGSTFGHCPTLPAGLR